MMRGLIKYSLWVCLFGIIFSQVDYNSVIQPIFDNNCIGCHGSMGGLNLTSYENLMNGGQSGNDVIPYDHASSELYNRITLSESSDYDMPPTGILDQSEIDFIAQWIEEGALSSPAGCTDPEAYNCDDDDGVNYTFEVGAITYVNGCNYELNDYLALEYVGGCDEGAPCEGFYNPDMTNDNGTCDYYQAPHGYDMEFTVAPNSIFLDWTDWAENIAPENAEILAYHVQRCTENCIFITESSGPPQNSPFSCWPDCPYQHTDTFVNDDNPWDSGVKIKYAINVQYSNAEAFGMAIGASYICPNLGDMDGDGGWNVLDIVILANCVLGDACAELDSGCASDMNGDGGWNVLDIVSLANCVLADNCGG